MKRLAVLVLIVFVMSGMALAKPKSTKKTEETSTGVFKDMPNSHWAAGAVNKLVNLGITGGYQDGTFRGNKDITRYETAGLMAKLIEYLGVTGVEKLAAELKTEIKSIKDEVENGTYLKKAQYDPFSGSFGVQLMAGNMLAGQTVPSVSRQGLFMNYRVTASFSPSMEGVESLSVNFDTMDGGLYGGSQDIFKMLDAELVIRPDASLPLTVSTTVGPGPQRHLSGIPSEVNRTYMRPYPGIKATTVVFGNTVSGYFRAHDIATSAASAGSVGVSQTGAALTRSFDSVPMLGKGTVTLRGDYFTENVLVGQTRRTNFKSGLNISAQPNDVLSYFLDLKAGSFRNLDYHKMVVSSGFTFEDKVRMQLMFDVKAVVAGSEYIPAGDPLDQWTMVGFDPFDRPLTNGSRSLQIKLKKLVSEQVSFSLINNMALSSSYRYGRGEAGSKLTSQVQLDMSLAQSTTATAAYRLEIDPNAAETTDDLLILGMTTRF